jgi:predicted Zn-dependent peptidase
LLNLKFEAPLVGEHTQLSNGVNLLAVCLPHSRRQVLYSQLAVGSRFETPFSNGLSHFLEHMMFRGTPSHPTAHDVALVFERWGGILAASTAADIGDWWVGVPAVNFERILRPFGEVLTAPLFNGIEVERGIVREEILETLDESGNCVEPADLVRQLVFGDHPLGMPITGSVQQVESFTESQLREHHRQFYSGGAFTTISVGPLPPDRVIEQLSEVFGALPSGAAPVVTPPEAQAGRRFKYVSHRSSQSRVCVAFRAPASFSTEEPAMDLLMRVLDDGMATRLYHRICDQLGLCYDVSGDYEAYLDAGLVELSAETGHERAAEVLRELLTLAQQLKQELVPSDELERCQLRFRWQMESALDSPGELAEYLALESRSPRPRTPSERIQMISELTPNDVQRVAQRWFTPDNLSVVVVGAQSKPNQRRLQALVDAFF